MTVRSAYLGILFATVLSAPLALAASGDSAARVGAVRAPAGIDARARAALTDSLNRYIVEEGLTESLRPYTVSPSLVQLRRYVEASPKQAKLVCVVDLALTDDRGNVAASVRGNATTLGVSPRETVDAAAHAAVMRLPGALQALLARQKPERVAAR